MPPVKVGEIHARTNKDIAYIDQIFKALDVNLSKGSLQVKLGANPYVTAVVGQSLDAAGVFVLSYVDEKQGLIKVHVTDNDAADTVLEAADGQYLEITMSYKKRGLSGVPTFMDKLKVPLTGNSYSKLA